MTKLDLQNLTVVKLDCNMSNKTWYECKRDLSASLFNNTKSPFTLTRWNLFILILQV